MIPSHGQEGIARVIKSQTPLADHLWTNTGRAIVAAFIRNHLIYRRGVANEIDLIIVVVKQELFLLGVAERARRVTARVPFIVLCTTLTFP